MQRGRELWINKILRDKSGMIEPDPYYYFTVYNLYENLTTMGEECLKCLVSPFTNENCVFYKIEHVLSSDVRLGKPTIKPIYLVIKFRQNSRHFLKFDNLIQDSGIKDIDIYCIWVGIVDEFG